MKTGILVHGFNLYAENWRRVVWGDAPEALGRVPQALLTAHTMEAEVIVFGTGASSRKFPHPESNRFGEEMVEAQYTLEYLKTFFNQMLYFKPWMERVRQCHDQERWQAYKEELLGKIVLDVDSQNTVQEIEAAGNVFLQRGVERVILISSPTHIVRVLRDANDIYQNDSRFASFRHDIHAVPCVTCYQGTRASDVVVVEPPHRPDRPGLTTHQRIKRMLALQKLDHDDLIQFIDEFEDLLTHFEEISMNGDIDPDLQEPLSDLLGTLTPRFAAQPPTCTSN